MTHYTTILLIFTSAAMIIGCASEQPVTPEIVKKPPPSVQPDESTKVSESEVLESTDTEIATVSEISKVAETSKFTDERPRDPERIVILARGGPLLLDVWLTIDGQPYGEGLGRKSGRSAAALTLRSRRSSFATASTSSRLWQLLDADSNGQLSAKEIDWASQRLFLLDTNDDRIIESSEFATVRDQLDTQNRRRTNFARHSTRDAAIYLEDLSEANRLDYVLSDLYAPRQQLGPASFSARPKLFAELDDDNNQSLDSQELISLMDIKPHIIVSLDFFSGDESTVMAKFEAGANLTLLGHKKEVVQVTQRSANRIVFVTSDTRLILSAHDLSGTQREGQVVDRNQIRLMVHDRGDSLFQHLDSNTDGRLGEREIAIAADRMRECDIDLDQQLNEEDLLVSMTVAFLRSEAPGEQSFYVPSFHSASVLETNTPSWFRQADFNNDGDVSRREFVGSSAQFSTQDTNRDGFISAVEANAPSS